MSLFSPAILSSLRCLLGASNGKKQSGAVSSMPRRTRQRTPRIALDDVIAGLAFAVICGAGFIVGLGM